jgi:hypothetical protein
LIVRGATFHPKVNAELPGAASALAKSAVEQVQCSEGRINTALVMKGFVQDIEGLAPQNDGFRKVAGSSRPQPTLKPPIPTAADSPDKASAR